MTPTIRVLLAEDDADLRVTTRLVLERHGFSVAVAEDGIEATHLLAAGDFDVALLDVVMPGLDGITLTKRIRATSNLPVVMLTARDLTSDQIVGLDAGADDYITKPFDGDVLAARLRAVVRRGAAPGSVSTDHVGDLVIDRGGMVVTKGGAPVSLSATEFRLLAALLDHAGAVLSRDQLLDLVWGSREWGIGVSWT